MKVWTVVCAVALATCGTEAEPPGESDGGADTTSFNGGTSFTGSSGGGATSADATDTSASGDGDGSDGPGQAGYGEPCELEDSCAEGLVCIASPTVGETSCAGAANCCTSECDLTEPNTCPGQGQTCVPLYDPPPPGLENDGVCGIA